VLSPSFQTPSKSAKAGLDGDPEFSHKRGSIALDSGLAR